MLNNDQTKQTRIHALLVVLFVISITKSSYTRYKEII